MRGLTCLALLVAVTLIDLGVPYFLFGDIASLWASYLFWTLLALLVILFAIAYTRQWGRRL